MQFNFKKKLTTAFVYSLLGPKTYYCELLGKDGKIRTIGKCKGCPQKLLTKEMYQLVLARQKPPSVLIRSLKKTSAALFDEYPAFSVFEQTIERSFLKELWEGRFFIEENLEQPSVPHGFEF